MFDKIKKWYSQGLWTAVMVERAVEKGVLTRTQADEILEGDGHDGR